MMMMIRPPPWVALMPTLVLEATLTMTLPVTVVTATTMTRPKQRMRRLTRQPAHSAMLKQMRKPATMAVSRMLLRSLVRARGRLSAAVRLVHAPLALRHRPRLPVAPHAGRPWQRRLCVAAAGARRPPRHRSQRIARPAQHAPPSGLRPRPPTTTLRMSRTRRSRHQCSLCRWRRCAARAALGRACPRSTRRGLREPLSLALPRAAALPAPRGPLAPPVPRRGQREQRGPPLPRAPPAPPARVAGRPCPRAGARPRLRQRRTTWART